MTTEAGIPLGVGEVVPRCVVGDSLVCGKISYFKVKAGSLTISPPLSAD
ncbi:hypothetical protein Spb1_35690 [Planctopirus ephydatiae]|uniref:Uncharacterized protein n=1 Tax=Planctopirus ephydatiae TaxID=2528019 RepID=A0A518GSR1_9PLAN|nr:hypothetical protein Spb1_35690 [Planctopirus ephydatiae]